MWLASLEDIIASKKAAGRPRDRAVLEILDERSMKRKNSRLEKEKAVRRESERALTDQIRRQLALPLERRTHFLRVRRPGGGSHL